MKQAKISITADTRGLKSQIETAKKQVEGLFKIKMSPEASNGFKRVLGEQLTGQIKGAEKELSGLQKRMEQIGKGSIVDPKRLDAYIKRTNDLTVALEKAKKTQASLGDIGSGKGGHGGGGGGETPTPDSGGGGVLGKFSGIAKAAGLALGAMYIYQRRLKMGQERTAIRETGSEVGDEKSELGFTPEERRSRMLATSKAEGRNLTADEMTKKTDLGETVQRAYGISQEESTGAMKVARQSGGEGDKYLANTIGAATAAGLEGSRIGEFLQASADSLKELSHGVTIDSGSLNGFAASLSTLPFFKSDPQKAFETIRDMNTAFTGGDRFQQAQAGRAIQEAAGGGLDPAAVEQRRSMGLFADIKPETRKLLDQAGAHGTAKAFGGDVTEKLVNNAVGQTKGMDKDSQLYEIMQRLGLKGEGGMEMAAKFMKAGGMKGSGVSTKDLKDAKMDPQERLNKTMENTDGHIVKLNATLEQSLDVAVDNLTKHIIELATTIQKWIDAMGGKGTTADLGGLAITIGTAVAAAVAIGLKDILTKIPGLGKGGIAGGGLKGMATMAGNAYLYGSLAEGGMMLNDANHDDKKAAQYDKDVEDLGLSDPKVSKLGAAKNMALHPATTVYGMSKGLALGGMDALGWASQKTGIGDFKGPSQQMEEQQKADFERATSPAAIEMKRKEMKSRREHPDQWKKFDEDAKAAQDKNKSADDNVAAMGDNTSALQDLTAAIMGQGVNGVKPNGGAPTVGRGAKMGAN